MDPKLTVMLSTSFVHDDFWHADEGKFSRYAVTRLLAEEEITWEAEET